MTPKSQRIAIAEACRWRQVPLNYNRLTIEYKEAKEYWTTPSKLLPDWFPNYLSDLNAMHEAEKYLTDEQHYNFRVELWEVTKVEERHAGMDLTHNRNYASATAAQRAEAFLRTLNLWED